MIICSKFSDWHSRYTNTISFIRICTQRTRYLLTVICILLFIHCVHVLFL